MQLIVVCLVVAHDLMGWGHGFSWHRLCGDIAHHCCCRHRYGARKSPEVALLFLRLGATSFGGPTAYIGLMHHEVVVRRKWIDDQRFLDLMSATMSLPGPNATEIASHLGLIRAGWRGLIAAGGLFILPGMAAILAVAWAYVRYGSLPEVAWVLYGGQACRHRHHCSGSVVSG